MARCLQSKHATCDGPYLVPALFEHRCQQLQIGKCVIDDENVGSKFQFMSIIHNAFLDNIIPGRQISIQSESCGSTSTSNGKVNWKTDPSPSWLSTQIRPP